MKKLFTTILMLFVALVGWSQLGQNEPNALSIPDNGWNSSTGELTVYHNGNGKCGPAEWEAILSAKGISAGSVTKLNLTGKFDNKAIKEASGNGVLEKLLGKNNSNTLYLDLSGCEYAYCEYTGINEAGTAFTYQPTQGSAPITETIHHSYTLRKEHVIESYNLRKEHVVESYTLRKVTETTYTASFYSATFSFDFDFKNADTTQDYPYTATNINQPSHTQSGTLKYGADNKWYFWTDGYNHFEVVEGAPKITYYNNETNEVVENVDESKLVATDTENIFTYVYNEYDQYINTDTNEVVENVDESKLVATDTENIYTYIYNEYDQYIDTTTNKVVENVDESNLVATDTQNVYTYSYDEVVTLSDGTPFALNQEGRLKINGITFPNNEHFTFIPESICSGPANEFNNPNNKWTALTTVVFPDNIVAIGPNAFLGASALANITWSTELQYIGLDVNSSNHVGPFQGCTSLTTVNLSNTKVKVIGKDAFNATTDNNLQGSTGNLTSVTLPSTLEIIGGEAFHSTKITSIVLAGCTKLEKLGFEAFENCTQLTTVTFPGKHTETVEGVTTETYNLTYIGNDLFKNSAITSIDMSMCEAVTEFQYYGRDGNNGYLQFANCNDLESIIFPPNLSFVPGNLGLFGDSGCPKLSSITFPGVAAGYDANGDVTNPLIIEAGAFWQLKTSEGKGKLSSVTFAENSNVWKIMDKAFYKTEIVDLDLSECHALRLIETGAFAEIPEMLTVKVCSHPKRIIGERTSGLGAFFHCTDLVTVEICACEGVTDITQCVCENGGFDFLSTYGQTADANLNSVATLIWPKDMPVGENSSYSSASDFFVGDYKAGILMNHDALQDFYKDIPSHGLWNCVNYDQKVHGASYYDGNGWLEFLSSGYTTVIPEGEEFLRTYSRTDGEGALELAASISAYRAIDYVSRTREWLLDNNGTHFDPVGNANPNDFVEIVTDEEDEHYTPASVYKGKKRYTYMTTSGDIVLKKLIVPGTTNTSYVPEQTGVVLYSSNVAHDQFLVLAGNGYTGSDVDTKYPKYPHTGARSEATRNKTTEPDNINMLEGTYGDGCGVAPVFPWTWSNPTAFTGGIYDNPKQYRNFGFYKDPNRWLRLKPGKAPSNLAFAMIHVSLFNNLNETINQQPDFSLPGDDGTSTGAALALIFEGEDEGPVVDGIKTVNPIINVDNNAWYTLQGVKVNNPTVGGVYIHNGQKVVIK